MGMESCFLYYSSALIKKLFFSLTHCGFTLKNQLIFTGRVDVYEFILAWSLRQPISNKHKALPPVRIEYRAVAQDIIQQSLVYPE